MSERLFIVTGSTHTAARQPNADSRGSGRAAAAAGTDAKGRYAAAGGARSAQPLSPSLRSGDTVLVHVLKHLSSNRWAVALQGRVFPASADTPLAPGKNYAAWVQRIRGGLVLHLGRPPQANLLQRLLGGSAARATGTEAVIAAMIRSQLAVSTQIIERLSLIFTLFKRKYGIRGKMMDDRLGRALALLTEKGIDPESPGGEAILRILADLQDRGEGGRKRQRRFRDFPNDGREIKADLSRREGSSGNPLQLFNQLKGSRASWLVIPFRYGGAEDELRGSLRILMDHFTMKSRRAVLEIVDSEGRLYCFALQRKAGKLEMGVYGYPDRARDEIRAKYGSLKRIMQNHGVECDDIIHDGGSFDGFSSSEDPSYPTVDTYT